MLLRKERVRFLPCCWRGRLLPLVTPEPAGEHRRVSGLCYGFACPLTLSRCRELFVLKPRPLLFFYRQRQGTLPSGHLQCNTLSDEELAGMTFAVLRPSSNRGSTVCACACVADRNHTRKEVRNRFHCGARQTKRRRHISATERMACG